MPMFAACLSMCSTQSRLKQGYQFHLNQDFKSHRHALGRLCETSTGSPLFAHKKTSFQLFLCKYDWLNRHIWIDSTILCISHGHASLFLSHLMCCFMLYMGATAGNVFITPGLWHGFKHNSFLSHLGRSDFHANVTSHLDFAELQIRHFMLQI